MYRKRKLIKVLFLALSLMLLGSCTVSSQNSQLDELIVKLGENDFRASMALQQKGLEAIPALQQALENPDYPNHLNIIFVLDRMELEETIPALKLGLGFGPKTRDAAAKALAKFEDLSMGQIAAELLLEEEDYQLGVASMITFAKQDRVEIVSHLLTNLALEGQQEEVVKRVANVLASVYVEQDKVAREAILDLLRQEAVSSQSLRRSVALNSYLRMAQIADGLGKFDELVPLSVSEQLVSILLDDLETTENRLVAAQALALIDPTSEKAIKTFTGIVLNPIADIELYRPAVNSLEKAGSLAKTYVPLLLLAVENLEEDLQWRLARVFVESGKIEQSVVTQVASLLADTESVDLAFYYTRILGAIGPNAISATDQLKLILTETKEPQLIEAIRRALEQIGV